METLKSKQLSDNKGLNSTSRVQAEHCIDLSKPTTSFKVCSAHSYHEYGPTSNVLVTALLQTMETMGL